MIPAPFLQAWSDAIASDAFSHHASTRYRVADWGRALVLPLAFTWRDAGFSPSKLTYLQRKYPLDIEKLPTYHLSKEGCIVEVARRSVLYRRVDLVKGWMADVLYLQWLGWSGTVQFSCPGDHSTIHAVRLSCVYPLMLVEGYGRVVPRLLRRTLRRAVVHRMERRYETYGQAKRANAWAHRLSTVEEMGAAVAYLDGLVD